VTAASRRSTEVASWKGGRCAGLGIAVVLLLLAVVPSAMADQGLPHLDRFRRTGLAGPIANSNGFRLAGTNGYTIEVVGVQEGEIALPVDLVAVIARARGARVEYVVPGTVSEDTISAQLSAFGSIDMRFEPSGTLGTYRQSCSRTLAKGQEGSWIGTFQFSGENGFTSASATEARPIWPGIGVCEESSVSSGGPGAWLSVSGPMGFNFDAAQNKGPGTPVEFEASGREQMPGLSIRSEIWIGGSAKTFTYDKRLRHALVRPPAPFSGSARFTRKSGQRHGTWSGSLRVDLPGLSAPVNLTSPPSFTNLQHGSHEQRH